MKDLGVAFFIKVIALVLLGIFFSYYKDLYPKAEIKRENLYSHSKKVPEDVVIKND
ncbi:MAG: hypothetical protein GW748_03050 [Alphaproteobacteria bacterium]|nr:hypothetical protein [Alphaproteobacteria bacterium]NCQ66704.1 hypothetical protein [Alphaproteobacteria bacterium]